MKIENVDNLFIASTKILEAVTVLSEAKFNTELQERLLSVGEYLLDQYEKHNKPTEEIQDIMNKISDVEL